MLKENSNSCYIPFAGQSVAMALSQCCGPIAGRSAKFEAGDQPSDPLNFLSEIAENQGFASSDFSSLYVLI